MKLIAAEVLPYRLPLRAPLRGIVERAGCLLRLRGAGALVGYGEASPVWWDGEETVEEARRALDAVAKMVAAGGVCSESLRGEAGPEGDFAEALRSGSRAALCAVDTALLDLEARKEGRAVAELLGARRLGELECNALLAAGDPAEVRAAVAALVGQGFRTIKLKVGSQPLAADIERVRAARAAGGPGVALRLDANRGWDFETACAALAAIGTDGVEYVEEPLRSSPPQELARLRRDTGARIAVDESVRDVADVGRFAEAAGCDVVVLKLARAGGPTRALDIARAAAAAGLRVVYTDSIETAVGRAATLHTAAAGPGECAAVGLGGSAMLGCDVDGAGAPAAAPSAVVRGPGLGLPDLRLGAGDGAGS